MLAAPGWFIGQSHATKKFSAHRFYTDRSGRRSAAPLLDAKSGEAALFDSPELAMASARAFDQQLAAA